MSILHKLFPVFYAINLFAYFLMPQLRLPGFPLNFQQTSQLVILAFCFFMDRGRLYGDRFLLLYGLFYLFCALDSLTTGYFSEFTSSIIRVFFAVYSFYWSSIILFREFNTIVPIIVPIIVIGVLDAVVTYFQLKGNHSLDPISLFLGTYDDRMVKYMETHDITYGKSLNGLFLNPVYNGHNLLTFFTLSFLLMRRKFSLSYSTIPLVLIAGLFFCQQRSAFFLAVLFLVIIAIQMFRVGYLSKPFVFLIVLGLLFSLSIFGDGLGESFYGSRLTTIDFDTRSVIMERSLDYIRNHPFGCEWQFHDEKGVYSHNLLLSAFIDAGWLGGIFLIILIVMQFSTITTSLKRKDIAAAVLGCAYLVLVADSMFHNDGIADGDGATWMVWGLFLSYYKNRIPKQ